MRNPDIAPEVAKPFTRVIATPAALPWDQVRAAELEARHTSPVSGAAGAELTLVVKRLEPWKPRSAGRFVAVYLRGRVPGEGLSFHVDVQGRPVKVEVASKEAQAEALRRKVWLLGGVAVLSVCLVAQVVMTVQRRAAIEDQLATLEPQVERAVKLHSTAALAKKDAQALQELDLHGRRAEDLLRAMGVVAATRDPAARIEAFLWDSGDWALEVRGDAPPLRPEGPNLQKAPKAVRRGVGLWVRTGSGGASGSAQ
jgi:hypothetical protein